ncbi:MAG: hypothetical protein GX849_04645 [Clostridiaceae bacterium]|nr:hypothetical protein [Clostridiaceae bacterium]
MSILDPIDSRMSSSYLESIHRPQEEIGFYLVASKRELLNHVEGLMNQMGVFGVLDQSGRVHYLLDGRKGSPFAIRKMMATTGRMIEDKQQYVQREKRMVRLAVDRVLDRYAWNRHLRGYRILVEMLRMSVTDISLISPISKRLYPELAKLYELTADQIERNVRYLLDDLAKRELEGEISWPCRLLPQGQTRLPVGRTITRLVDQVGVCLEALEEETKAGDLREERIFS